MALQAAASSTTPLLFHAGGHIQLHPRVYLIFWGPKWTTGNSGITGSQTNLFSHLANSTYNKILAQYNDPTSGGYVHNDTTLAGTWTDTATPTGTIDGGRLQQEAVLANSKNKWTNSADTQYLVFTQAGTTLPSSVACAYHTYDAGFVLSQIPYLSDSRYAPCAVFGSNLLDEMTAVSSHEYAEAATNPRLDAWKTDEVKFEEIGDLCEPGTTTFTATGIAPVHVSTLWSVASDTCVGSADTGAKVSRLAGATRTASSVAYSEAVIPGHASSGAASAVVVARASDPGWVDATPGASLAAVNEGPVLLAPADCSSADYMAMETEIQRVLSPGSGKLYVVGGTAGVPDCVLANNGAYNPVRIVGTDRCASSVNVANFFFSGIKNFSPERVNLVSGDNFADAISISSLAAKDLSATVVAPATGGAPPTALCSAADAFLVSYGNVERNFGFPPVVRIAGGTSAVSAAVEAEVNNDVCPATRNCTVRYAGATRYDTAVLVAGASSGHYAVSTGLNWPDGVSGSVLASRAGSTMLLDDTGATQAGSFISRFATTSSLGFMLGGTTVEPRANDADIASHFPAGG